MPSVTSADGSGGESGQVTSPVVTLYTDGTCVAPKRHVYRGPWSNIAPDSTTRVLPAVGPLVGEKLETRTGASYVSMTASDVYCWALRLTSTATSVGSISASLERLTSSKKWLSVARPLLAASAKRHEARGANAPTSRLRQSTVVSRSMIRPRGESAVL